MRMAEKRRGARGHAVSARLKYNHQITDIGAGQLDFVRKQIERGTETADNRNGFSR